MFIKINEITDIWFHTKLSLDKLTQKLDLVLEEFDCENVWEWTISSFGEVKIDICRNHTETHMKTFTNIFRIDENKKPFSEEILNHLVTKLKAINITPIYLGKLWIGANETFEYETIQVVE